MQSCDAKAPQDAGHAPCRVLVIEDEDNIALALQYVIQKEGHQYFRVSNGAEGERAIEDIRPHLILLDIMLPEVSGYDICRSVRGRAGHAATKIIMMTARGSAYQRDRAKEAGADEFLAKPFSLDELRAKLRSHLHPA